MVVALGEIAEDDGYDGFGGLIDENGLLVQVEGVLQLAFVELAIFIEVVAGRIAFVRLRRESGV